MKTIVGANCTGLPDPVPRRGTVETLPPSPIRNVRPVHVSGVGSAWLYRRGHVVLIEHCDGGGHWSGCVLTVKHRGRRVGVFESRRVINLAIHRHLSRKPHRGPFQQALAGVAHGGGGEQIDGVWVKGPPR